MSDRVKPPTEEEYARRKVNLAFQFAPRIYPCAKCGWPVASGWCCPTCGDDAPEEADDE